MGRIAAIALSLALIAAGCGDDDDDGTTPSTTAESTTTTAVDPAPTSTTIPGADCDEQDAYAVADEAIATARLAPGGGWSTDTAGNEFDERTRSGEWLADELALDCGVKATQTTDAGDERLLLAAWTGPRIAFVIQATDQPPEPYAATSILTVVTEDPFGEYLVEDQSLWAGQLEGGETLIVGHRDYNLGVVAKAWQSGVEPPGDAEPTLDSERHAIETLEAAGMRKVAVAQPAELGSEEGAVMFISPSGQISVADVAPVGTFDPLQPRYFTGETTTTMVGDVEVRVTEAADGEQYGRGVEVGWGCGDWVWLLQPATNGTAEEMVEVAGLIIEADDC